MHKLSIDDFILSNKFDSNQLTQIDIGINHNVDVSKYAIPKLSYKKNGAI